MNTFICVKVLSNLRLPLEMKLDAFNQTMFINDSFILLNFKIQWNYWCIF